MGYLRSKASRNSLLLTLSGLILLFFGGYNYYRIRILSFAGTPTATQTAGDRPTQITIPSLKIDLKIEPGQIKNDVWQISYQNATFLDGSASPGTKGNIVIYGHNKKLIFGNLPYLSIGQKISLKTESGKIYQYEVYKKDFVKPDRMDLVSPTNHEELTIFTCWGLFDSQRVVVKARPLYNSP